MKFNFFVAIAFSLVALRVGAEPVAPACTGHNMMGKLEIFLLLDKPAALFSKHVTFGKLQGYSDGNAVIGNDDITAVQNLFDSSTHLSGVRLFLTNRGALRMATVTRAEIGRRFAVTLDGRLLESPIITGPVVTGQIRLFDYQSFAENAPSLFDMLCPPGAVTRPD